MDISVLDNSNTMICPRRNNEKTDLLYASKLAVFQSVSKLCGNNVHKRFFRILCKMPMNFTELSQAQKK